MIIGKPLTLSRVLNAFGKKNLFRFRFMGRFKKETLEEQSEETQRKFNELISEI